MHLLNLKKLTPNFFTGITADFDVKFDFKLQTWSISFGLSAPVAVPVTSHNFDLDAVPHSEFKMRCVTASPASKMLVAQAE